MIKSTLSVLALVGSASLAMAMPGHGDGPGTNRSSGCGMTPGHAHAMEGMGPAMHGAQGTAMQAMRAQHLAAMHPMHPMREGGGTHAPMMGRRGEADTPAAAAERPTPKAAD